MQLDPLKITLWIYLQQNVRKCVFGWLFIFLHLCFYCWNDWKACSDTAVWWHSIYQSTAGARQQICLCWSFGHEQHIHADPTSVQWGQCFRPVHSLLSLILEAVCDKPCSVLTHIVMLEDRALSLRVQIWGAHLLQNLISLSVCIKMLSTDDKPYFSSDSGATAKAFWHCQKGFCKYTLAESMYLTLMLKMWNNFSHKCGII